jgi:heat shock protein HslJ
MTMMACPHMKIETKFLNALGSVRAWKMESNNLELLDNNRSMIIRFEAISKVK